MEQAKEWKRNCPHCQRSIIVDTVASIVKRPGRRSVGGAGKESTIEIQNPVEASDALWAWRNSLNMTIRAASMHVGIDKSTWTVLELAERKQITKVVHKKIEEATGICL